MLISTLATERPAAPRMDIILQVIRDEPPDAALEPGRWERGDVVRCYLRSELVTDIDDPSFACRITGKSFFVIRDYPDDQLFDDVREEFQMIWSSAVQAEDLNENTFAGRREWILDMTSLQGTDGRDFDEFPHVLDKTWNQAKGRYVKNRETGRKANDGEKPGNGRPPRELSVTKTGRTP